MKEERLWMSTKERMLKTKTLLLGRNTMELTNNGISSIRINGNTTRREISIKTSVYTLRKTSTSSLC
jgi:hypothetical protein